MNAELLQKALGKVGNAHILINMVSRRVRQINAGARPLVANTANLGIADIALREVVEEKMGWVVPELEKVTRPIRKRGNPRTGVKLLRASAPQVINAVAA